MMVRTAGMGWLLVWLSAVAIAQVEPSGLRTVRQVGPGIALRQGSLPDAAGRPQFVSVLDIDTATPGIRFGFAAPARGLDETSDLARRAGAIAAINAGFFTKERQPDGAFRIDGHDLGILSAKRPAAVVLDDPALPRLQEDATGAFAGARTVLAAGPVLLRAGEFPQPSPWNDARHPRSAIGTTADRRVLLVTVDGRAKEATGMTFAELAATMRALGCHDAINLDGGGSTTLWLQDAQGNGVVNHPCDDKRFDPAGERAVINAIIVHATRPAHEPRLAAEERVLRGNREFSLTRQALLTALQRRVRAATDADLSTWDSAGLLDSLEIAGERRFHQSAVSNLFFRDAGARTRRLHGATWIEPSFDTGEKTFTIRMTLTVAADAVPAGEEVRAWLPFPQRDDWQTPQDDDTIPDAPMRARHLIARAAAGQQTLFRSEFTFTRRGVRTAGLDAEKAHRPTDRRFTEEQPPHVMFTPALRALAKAIVGDEANPLRIARRCYDWCADHLTYSFAREYVTIADIPAEVLATRRADCGQATLLFMTLCRLHGIPARWQSGWTLLPGHENLHDWCAIRIEPWGWLPIDVNAAIELRHADGLDARERASQRDFWFGNLDAWRFVANRDHGRDLAPPKTAVRSDDVDFQRGEAEWGSPARNLWYEDLDWRLEVVGVK
ncbi:MAG: phosphodiester glycosidase family protein [Planctomycetes bacterium]|nr:phosphodiester glycosidase family protein [Planctomycetota bacterium]